MCKSIAEATGESSRRCPSHQSISVLAIKQMADKYDMSVTFAKSVFLATRENTPEPEVGYQGSLEFQAYKREQAAITQTMTPRYKALAQEALEHEIDDRTSLALTRYEQMIQAQVLAESRLLHNLSLHSGISHEALLHPELVDEAYASTEMFHREDYEELRTQAGILEEQYGYVSNANRVRTVASLAAIVDSMGTELTPTHTSDDGTVIYSESLGIVETHVKGVTYSYKNIGLETAKQLLNPRTRAQSLKAIRQDTLAHQWASEGERALGVRGFGSQKCRECGQFMGKTHECESTAISLKTLSDYDKWIIEQAKSIALTPATATTHDRMTTVPEEYKVYSVNNAHYPAWDEAKFDRVLRLPSIEPRDLEESQEIMQVREVLSNLDVVVPKPTKQVRSTDLRNLAKLQVSSDHSASEYAEELQYMIEQADGHFTIDFTGSLSHIVTGLVDPRDSTEIFPSEAPVNAQLEGNILLRQQWDGSFSVLSSKELKCNCDTYKENYYCEHVRLMESHALGHAELISKEEVANNDVTSMEASAVISYALSKYGTSLRDSVERYSESPDEAGDYRVVFNGTENKELKSHSVMDNALTSTFIQSFPTVEEFLDFRDKYDGYSFTTLNPDLYADVLNPETAPHGISPLPIVTYHSVRDQVYEDPEGLGVIYTVTHWVNEHGEYEYAVSNVECSCGVRHLSSRTQSACDHVQSAERFAALAAGHLLQETGNEAQETNEDLYLTMQDKLRMDRLRDSVHEDGALDEQGLVEVISAMRDVATRDAIAREEIADAIMQNAARNPSLKEFRNHLESDYDKSLDDYLLEFIPEYQQEFYNEALAFRRERVQARELSYEEGFQGKEEVINDLIEKSQQKRKRLGKNSLLEPLTSEVTNGICDPDVPGSLRFGVELEFDFPSSWSDEKVAKKQAEIAQELYDLQLTGANEIMPYHSSGAWEKWNYEADLTVRGGEVVSPVLADTPEAWAELDQALQVIKKHGGQTSMKAGSHVNISSSVFASNVASNVELLRLGEEHQEALFAVATSPYAQAHRGRKYCEPNLTTPRGDVSQYDPDFRYLEGGSQQLDLGDDFSSNTSAHGAMINLENSFTHDNKSRVEFRQWDSSLDLATIQTQVAVSAALVDTAQHTVSKLGYSPARLHDTLEPVDKVRLSAANLADKIFLRHSDRERMLALFMDA